MQCCGHLCPSLPVVAALPGLRFLGYFSTLICLQELVALVPRTALHLHLDWEQTPMLSSSSSWWWHAIYATEPGTGTQLQVRPWSRCVAALHSPVTLWWHLEALQSSRHMCHPTIRCVCQSHKLFVTLVSHWCVGVACCG